jgi:hypothetical protein
MSLFNTDITFITSTVCPVDVRGNIKNPSTPTLKTDEQSLIIFDLWLQSNNVEPDQSQNQAKPPFL